MSDYAVQALLRNQRFDLLDNNEDRRKLAQRSLLFEHPLPFARSGRRNDLKGLGLLADMISYYQYGIALNDETSISLKQALETRFHYFEHQPQMGKIVSSSDTYEEFSPHQREAVKAYLEFVDIAPAILSGSLQPWVTFVEALRAGWGDCPAIDRIAILAAH
jgi:hypothetical protein